MPSTTIRIGVDLGGTKIEAAALDDSGELIARRRLPTPREDYRATVDAIQFLVTEVEKAAGATAATVGIGIPGAVSPHSGLIKNANSTWLIGQPFADDLQVVLGKSVRLANDANCFALSEAVDGAGVGGHCVFGAILGTGVGGGLVIAGKILAGRNLITGEWGHTPLPWPDADEWPGPDCYCGGTGCIETFLSGAGLARSHGGIDGVLLDGEKVAELATNGDLAALAALDIYEKRLAKALTIIINIVDPDIIVLGGGLSNIQRLYKNVPALWQGLAFSDKIDTQLVPARHGDSSGVRGAAWLWPQAPQST